jgi:hypothetical protein
MNNWDFFHLDGMVPPIRQHSNLQLNLAIKRAERTFPDFYVLLHGIDAYMERRRRRRMRRSRGEIAIARAIDDDFVEFSDPWGNS